MIPRPDPETLRTWGVLAHVDAEERERILRLPTPDRKRKIDDLRKAVAKLHKRR